MADRSLTALIVDDEAPARRLLAMLCATAGIAVAGEADCGEAALAILGTTPVDLVLLDIAMPGIDGMETAQRLARGPGAAAPAPAIVFTTAFAAHAVAAFDVGAVDYLLKPIEPARFAIAIDRARAALAGGSDMAPADDHFWVPHRSDLVRIDAAAVERVEAERDYVRLHLGDRSCLLRETMDRIADRLPGRLFVRVHRSAIVRRDRVTGLRHEGGGVWSVVLADGTAVRIGRSYLDAARAL